MCIQSATVVEDVSGEVADLQQKLAILQAKRQEDKARLKELEKYRIQVQQVITLASTGSTLHDVCVLYRKPACHVCKYTYMHCTCSMLVV